MAFPRICTRCMRRFQPEGRLQKLCRDCFKDVRNANFIKMINVRMSQGRKICSEETKRRLNL